MMLVRGRAPTVDLLPPRTGETSPARRARHRAGLAFRLSGVACLVVAASVVVYLVWLLWGTGLSTARVQRDLRAEIASSIAHPHHLPRVVPVGAVHFAHDRPVMVIRIPRIHLDMVVVEGADTDALRKGPGHYTGTAYPWDPGGRVAIAGHRTTYLHPFWSLDRLRRGNAIWLVSRYGSFEYHVTGTRTVLPTASWVLEQTDAPTLVLTTCTPRFSASHRLVVFAARDGG